MRTAAVRIARVRLKGGADLVCLPGRKRQEAMKMVEMLQRSAAMQSVTFADDLVGFAMVAWNHKTEWLAGWAVTRGGPITATAMPSFVHDVLLKERIEKSLTEGE